MSHRSFDVPPEALARMGEGHVAYVREMTSDDLARVFPGGPELPPGLKLWALIGAAGAPILVADDRDVALASALENDLIAVSLH